MAKNPNYLNCKTVFCCSICGKEVIIRVNEGDYMGYYRDGDSSEEAFPYLTEKERQMIDMGLCEECVSKYDYPIIDV
jgi:hypothetical protein